MSASFRENEKPLLISGGGDNFCEVRACNAFIRREFHWKGEYPINVGYILPTNTKLVSFANYTTAINIFNEENNYDCIQSLIDWADSSFSGKKSLRKGICIFGYSSNPHLNTNICGKQLLYNPLL